MPDRFKEKTDWSNIEQALLKHGLDFNRYGIKFNDRNFELTRMYLSGDYTIFTFYNQKGFKSMFNGMEFPLLVVAEYEDAIEDINKERPDDIRIFDDADDGYSYASHLDSRAEEYSRYKNSRDFWLTQKELCEGVEMKDIEIKEEVRIPGTDIILEAGDKIYFKESYDHARYVLKASPYKPNVWKVSWIDDYWDKSGYFFMDDAGSFENSKFYEPGSVEIWKSIPNPRDLIKNTNMNFGLYPNEYPFGKNFILEPYKYKVNW